MGVAASDELAAFADRRDLVLYDAPVQGTRGPAEQGKLVILAAGPDERRDAAQPVFDAIAQRTVWISEHAGQASRLKLALNAWAFALTHGIAESLALAKGLGVDPSLVIDVVSGGPMDSDFFQLKATAILHEDYATSFSVENAIKDTELTIEAATDTGVRIDTTAAGLNRFQRALAAGHGDADMAASHLAS